MRPTAERERIAAQRPARLERGGGNIAARGRPDRPSDKMASKAAMRITLAHGGEARE